MPLQTLAVAVHNHYKRVKHEGVRRKKAAETAARTQVGDAVASSLTSGPPVSASTSSGIEWHTMECSSQSDVLRASLMLHTEAAEGGSSINSGRRDRRPASRPRGLQRP